MLDNIAERGIDIAGGRGEVPIVPCIPVRQRYGATEKDHFLSDAPVVSLAYMTETLSVTIQSNPPTRFRMIISLQIKDDVNGPGHVDLFHF
jgi:hypothetical protein